MKTLLILSTLLLLYSCDIGGEKYVPNNGIVYTVQVNYVGISNSSIPPSDTLTFVARTRPFIRVVDNTPSLIADDWYYPVASYVRSFKILKEVKL